jgi:hypothetical protein
MTPLTSTCAKPQHHHRGPVSAAGGIHAPQAAARGGTGAVGPTYSDTGLEEHRGVPTMPPTGLYFPAMNWGMPNSMAPRPARKKKNASHRGLCAFPRAPRAPIYQHEVQHTGNIGHATPLTLRDYVCVHPTPPGGVLTGTAARQETMSAAASSTPRYVLEKPYRRSRDDTDAETSPFAFSRGGSTVNTQAHSGD